MASNKETATAEVLMDGKKAASSIKDLENNVRALTGEWRKMTIGTEEYIAKAAEIQKINTTLVDQKKNVKAVADEMDKNKSVFDSAIGSIKEKLVALGGAMAAAFAVDKIADYFKEGIKKAFEMRDAEKMLLDVLDGNKAKQRELIDLAKERAGSTKFTKIEIEEAEKFLVIQGRSQEQIRKTITASMDLATVTGNTLKNSVEDLDGTMEGRLGKSLGKLSQEFKNLSKDQLYNGNAIEIVARKYKGLAEGEMETTQGKLIMMQKSWGALQRTIGDALIGTGGVLTGLMENATSALNTVKKLFEVPLATKLQEEGVQVNALADQLMQANIPAETRNKLYKELEGLAPKVTEGLDSENISYEKLTKNLSNYNNELVNNIIIQKENDKISRAAETLANIQAKRKDSELTQLQRINQVLQEQKLRIKQGTDADPVTTIKWIKETETVLNNSTLNITQKLNELSKGVKGSVGGAMEAQMREEKAAQAQLDNLFNHKKEILTSLGITETVVAKTTAVVVNTAEKSKLDFKKMTLAELENLVNENSVKPQSKGMIEIEKAAQKEINLRTKTAEHEQKLREKTEESYKKMIESMENMELENFANNYTRTQQEIRNVEKKYNDMIEIAIKYKEKEKKLSPDQKKEVDDNITKLEIARDAQIKQVLTQAEQKFADDVAKIHENLRVARMSITERQIYEVNKKYEDAQAEILSAIKYAYDEEVIAAKGNAEKIAIAEKNKADAELKIRADVETMKAAQKAEINDVHKNADIKFNEELKNLELKSEQALAIGKEKIHLEVNAKYKKLLDDNVKDEAKIKKIKAQMDQEEAAREVQLKKETQKKLIEGAIAIAKGAADGLSSIFSMQNDAENQRLKEDEAANTQKKDNLKKMLDAKIITQKEYDARVGKMDQDLDNKKKKMEHDQAQRAKQLALFNALINVAQAVAAALTAGPGVGIALSIITAALGAIQVGYILSSKVPQADKGRYNVVGADDNRSYSNVPFVGSPRTGLYSTPTLISETGPEYVIDPRTTRNLMMNYPHVINAIEYARVPQRAMGNYPAGSSSSTAGAMSQGSAENQALLEALNAFNANARQPQRSFVVYQDIRTADDTMRSIESDVSKQ